MVNWVFLATLLAFLGVFGYIFYQNIKLKDAVFKLRHRNPLEIDLELATLEQLLGELKKRPIRYLLILPNFKVDEQLETVHLSGIGIESCGMPENVVKDLIRATSEMMGVGHDGPAQSQ